MGRGNPCPRGLPWMVCSLLLISLTGAEAHSRLGFRRQPLDAADVANAGANEADLAVHASEKTLDQAAGAHQLIGSEHKKLRAHINGKAKALLPASMSGDDGQTNYLISSFPELRCVNYVRLPDLVWRPLVVSGIVSPKAIAVDADRARLYISDTAVGKILWYQLLALPDGKLVSDGRQHVAVQAVAVRNMALDLTGSLWFSAKSLPAPPIPHVDAIWKQTLMAIDQGSVSGVALDPVAQWTAGATQSSVSPLVLDAFNIYYGNDMKGKEKGSVVKASQSVPIANPSSGLTAMADNSDTTYSVAVTPTSLFYGADNAIYGVIKTKVGGSCGATGNLCTVVSDLVKKPTAMLWDGDGTIYVADNGNGAIYSFASGSVSPHAIDKVIDAGEVWGLDVFKVVRNQDSSAKQGAQPFALAMLFAAAVFIANQ